MAIVVLSIEKLSFLESSPRWYSVKIFFGGINSFPPNSSPISNGEAQNEFLAFVTTEALGLSATYAPTVAPLPRIVDAEPNPPFRLLVVAP